MLDSSSKSKDCNYMGYSDCSSSVDSSAISVASEESRSNMNLKATELRLGLPGSQSPGRDAEFGLSSSSKLDEKPFFPMHCLRDGNSTFSQKGVVFGNKRGFCDDMSSFSEGNFISDSDVNVVPSPMPANLIAKNKEAASPIVVREKPLENSRTSGKHMNAPNHRSGPPPKAQVVGWPPIRSFRKKSLANTSKNADEVDRKAGVSVLFVKVSMDGAPYLRKVNLKAYTTYQELSSALDKMFSCFTIVQCTSHVTAGKEILSESKLKDIVHGSEYVLTYEDKDGDWMLVGDVPWEMFIDTCKRLRIMKSSDAIGLAPRVIDKCKKRS